MHMQALAMVASGSVTILSHPSLQGMSSGSGLSGSTAWHGAFRPQSATSQQHQTMRRPNSLKNAKRKPLASRKLR